MRSDVLGSTDDRRDIKVCASGGRQYFRFIIQAPVGERQERQKKRKKNSPEYVELRHVRRVGVRKTRESLWENLKIVHVNRPIALSIITAFFHRYFN